MTPADMGTVYNQLVERRAIYTFTSPGRRRSQAEKDAADILERQYGRTGALEEFLATQGLALKVYDASQIGVGNAGRVYVAVRDPLQSAPMHLSGKNVLQEIFDERRAESAATAAMWSTFLMLLMLEFLYTREGRQIEAISAFKDSAINLEDFIEEAQARVESIRQQAETGSGAVKTIRQELVSASASTIEARARAFLNSMVRLGVLDVDGDSDEVSGKVSYYRQTLWSAVDVANNFYRHAGPLSMAGLDEVVRVSVAKPITPQVI